MATHARYGVVPPRDRFNIRAALANIVGRINEPAHLVSVPSLDPDQITCAVALRENIAERMVGTFGIHVPHTTETGPLQEIDRLSLPPVTEGSFSLDPFARLVSHHGGRLPHT